MPATPTRFRRPAVVLALAVGLGGFAATPARAGFVIQGGTEQPGNPFSATQFFMFGYDFVPTTNQSLTALGFWDQGANGLPGSYRIGVWNTNTQNPPLLASVTVGNEDPLDLSLTLNGGNYRYETLATPIALTAGTTYTLGWQVGPNTLLPTDTFYINYPTLVSGPNVTIGNLMRANVGGGFGFPTGSVPLNSNSLFLGNVNAILVADSPAAATPAPPTVLMLGAGAVALAGLRRRMRAD